MKDKQTAIILCVLLGCFGIHQFYLGENTKGVLWLLGYWFFIFPIGFILLFVGIGWVLFLLPYLDIIPLANMSNEEFNNRYNGGKKPNNIGTISTKTADELEKLHALKNKGILTEKEFQERKKKLLQ